MAVDLYRSHRGAILEEVVLYILSRNGYLPVTSEKNDESLIVNNGALRVRGRGSTHQIDAIADARYSPPFCHQQRLLIEAKFLGQKVGLGVIRNAAGVVKDVSEYWVPVKSAKDQKRYHYMYGVFSKSDFSSYAQEYAFAHDIYLLPLEKNRFFKPIIDAIGEFGVPVGDDEQNAEPTKPQFIRNYLRSQLLPSSAPIGVTATEPLSDNEANALDRIVSVTRSTSHGYMTTLGGSFPIFLMAHQDLGQIDLGPVTEVEIYYDQTGWWEIRRCKGETLFTFDLPEELFNLYAESGNLGPDDALRMKEERMSGFDILLYSENKLELKQFRLSWDWLERAKRDARLSLERELEPHN
jgi:hypothetical protein